MITFEDIWLWQEERLVLKGINCTIKTNERVAILGPSGAGKTTILKLILGLLHPDSGRVLIDNENIALLSEETLDKLRLKFSIVFQEGALFDSLSVRENVAFFFKEHTDFSLQSIDEQVNMLLTKVDLSSAADMMPEELSGGMKRRVSIARSLAVSQAQMNLYDEPTSGLDPVNADIIRSLIIRLASDNKGLIVVTHEIFDAFNLALRFIFLSEGTILFDGDKQQFLHSSLPQIQEFLKPYQRYLTLL
jgi:phospholipid/cholesterol/gamma-HCH transport system ATP-binding protein